MSELLNVSVPSWKGVKGSPKAQPTAPKEETKLPSLVNPAEGAKIETETKKIEVQVGTAPKGSENLEKLPERKEQEEQKRASLEKTLDEVEKHEQPEKKAEINAEKQQPVRKVDQPIQRKPITKKASTGLPKMVKLGLIVVAIAIVVTLVIAIWNAKKQAPLLNKQAEISSVEAGTSKAEALNAFMG